MNDKITKLNDKLCGLFGSENVTHRKSTPSLCAPELEPRTVFEIYINKSNIECFLTTLGDVYWDRNITKFLHIEEMYGFKSLIDTDKYLEDIRYSFMGVKFNDELQSLIPGLHQQINNEQYTPILLNNEYAITFFYIDVDDVNVDACIKNYFSTNLKKFFLPRITKEIEILNKIKDKLC